MIHIKEAIVVEGRYDVNAIKQLVDAPVLETRGFGIFRDAQRLALLRQIADKRGLIILTDSDGAGFVIRNYLKGALPPGQVKHAYIPDVYGKEKRKRSASREGKMGVEGMDPETLLTALRRAGATVCQQGAQERITKADLFACGLSGAPDSAQRRQRLLSHLSLPEHLSPNAMIEVLNALMSREECLKLLRKI